jgi:peptidoglycan hydrolase-like protein with peptidoglycan-binding domain|tara:strand:- start:33656 stop:35419 length:1764 start_codon:yes stop_codon:yes gene_type:complete
VPKKILTILMILSLPLFISSAANADWLDKLKDTATELTDKAAEALKEAEPESPTTSDGEGQAKKPTTATAPAAPKAPAQSTVAAPTTPKTTAPAPAAPSGNNDKALVMATQEELKRLGYKIGVDGAYGPNTKKQIISFQNSQNMAATGNVTPDLVAALKAAPTPNTEPATTTTTAAPTPKAEEPKAAEAKAEPKVEKAAAPQISLNQHDYDRAYLYEEKQPPELQGAWVLRKTKGEYPLYAHIKDDELIVNQRLQKMKPLPGREAEVIGFEIMRTAKTYFNKSSKQTVATILFRFDNSVITANVITNGAHRVLFSAKGAEVSRLLSHVQNGGDFEYRLDNFEPFLYSEDWTTFRSPPPEIAAAKQAENDKQAAAMAAAQATQKVEQEKSAATAATLSPEGKVAYEQCNQSHSAKIFYSCQCIAQNIGTHVDKVVASETEESEKIFIYHYGEDGKRAFENIDKANLTAEQKAEKKKRIQENMDRDKQRIADLENRAAWDDKTRNRIVNTASIWAYKDPVCKIGEGMREKEYGACMSSPSSSKVSGKTAEEYCSCSADTAAKLWTSSNQTYSSKVAVGLPVQARTQCRN